MAAIRNKRPLKLRALLQSCDCVDFVDKNDSPLFHRTVRYGYYTLFLVYVRCRVNINAQDADGKTALHLLTECSLYRPDYMDGDAVSSCMVDVLLHWGANPDIPDLKDDLPRDHVWNRDYVPMRIRELVIGTQSGCLPQHPQ